MAAPLSTANEQLYKLSEPLTLAGMPIPVLFLPFSSGAAPLDVASWDCDSVTVTGALTDADGDGIPVNASYNGRCTWSYSGGEGSFSGYWQYNDLNVQDPNDADPEAGIKVSGEVEWGFSGGGDSLTWTWTLTRHDLVKQGSQYDFDYEGSWQVDYNGDTYTFSYNLSGTWTPDDAQNPWGDGTLNAIGSFSGTDASCASGWDLEVSLSGVHYTGGLIDSGTASFSGTDCDGTSTSVTITWSAAQVCITVDSQDPVCVPNS
ncbi:hypothetical protein ODE01S_22530 [Oceanithermus desulfurans NBRC 100063]|uniref:Uncharacterized protein n=1 Tax=Oceanithermus desulfurans NBRC 100063 TaxID=1227550 RepID=A0A511RME6_9DEIN|nr:hypothetical protein ODE01S_22530 [Oceanithermus desulfurans NBRC 100063]